MTSPLSGYPDKPPRITDEVLMKYLADDVYRRLPREGTFTPSYTGGVTNPTCTYSLQQGNYVRIGRMVFVSIALQINALTVAGAGNLSISGLPFVGANSLSIDNNAARAVPVTFGSGFGATTVPYVMHVTAGASTGLVYGKNSADVRDNFLIFPATILIAGCVLLLQGFYYTNDVIT